MQQPAVSLCVCLSRSLLRARARALSLSLPLPLSPSPSPSPSPCSTCVPCANGWLTVLVALHLRADTLLPSSSLAHSATVVTGGGASQKAGSLRKIFFARAFASSATKTPPPTTPPTTSCSFPKNPIQRRPNKVSRISPRGHAGFPVSTTLSTPRVRKDPSKRQTAINCIEPLGRPHRPHPW